MIGTLSTGLVAAGAWAASEGLNNYCDTRDQFAPGGQASPAAPCEFNREFRNDFAETVGALIDAVTPDLPDHDPIFDPYGEK